jgi:hypothetical protein
MMITTLAPPLLVALSTGGAYSVGDTNSSPEKVEVERIRVSLDRLTCILNVLAPVRAAQPSLIGAPPNFVGVSYCWSFDNGGPDLYRRVEQVIKSFHGDLQWRFNPQFNQKGASLSVLRGNDFYSSIPDSTSPRVQSENEAERVQHSFVDEIDELCRFMESEFGIVGQERNLPNQHSAISDLYESSVYDVVLVRDVDRFRWPTPTSDADETLDFGITYDEWYALFFQALGKSEGQTGSHPVDFQREVDGYPILSRLHDIHDSATVDASEVGRLESECLRLNALSKDNAAVERCARKLLLMCRRATDLKTGIYFAGQ